MIDSGSMEGGAARSPVFRFAWVGRAALAATILPELTAAAVRAVTRPGLDSLAILAAFGALATCWLGFWFVVVGHRRRIAALAMAAAVAAIRVLGILLSPRVDHHRPFLAAGLMLGAGLGWRAGLGLLGGLVVLTVGWESMLGVPAADVALDVVWTALVGLTAVVVRLGLVAARELEVAREELARLAIAEERLRFAGDLNRLLGDRLDLLAVTIDELAADGSADGIESRRARTRRLAGDARATLRAVRSAVDSFRRPPAASRG